MTGLIGDPLETNFYDRSVSITERYEKLWGRWSSDSQLLHVITEVCEVRDVIRNKKDKYGVFGSTEWKEKFLDEMADIFLTSLAACAFYGISAKDMNFAIKKKLMTVEKRVEDEEKTAREFAHNLMQKISGDGDVTLD